MSDLNTEIKITASADGVETGVARAKRSLAGLKEEATRSGAEAGRGMAPLGDGAEAAARKVDSATRNMQASLQRQIAALEAGGTATRQYQESLAKLRGVDANAIKPLLDQLDAAKAKAEGAGQGLNGLGTASSFLQGQLAALAGSLTLGSMAAFVLQINNGIDALNDIKDATGSTIENISALEDIGKRTGASLDLVGGVLIKFNDVLSKAGPKSDIALQLQAIGLSAEELKRIDPAEALLKTAQALSQFADDGNKARLIQDLFGKSVKDAAPFLADLAEKGQLVATVTSQQADQADKFNKQLFALQANAQSAGRQLGSQMVTTLLDLNQAFSGSTEKASLFSSVADGVGVVFETLAVLGANVSYVLKTTGTEFGVIAAQAAAVARGEFSQAAEIGRIWRADAERARADIDALTERILSAKQRVSAAIVSSTPGGTAGTGADDRPAVQPPKTAAEIEAEERKERERRAKAEAAVRAAAALRERELAEQRKFFADMAGLSGDYYDKLAQAQKERAAGNITEAQYIQYVEQLIQKQPFATALLRDNAAAIKAQATAAIEAAKASSAYYNAIGQDLAKLEEQNQRLREEGEQIGLNAQGLLALTLARQDHAIAIEAERLALLQANEGSAEEILLQQRRIALLKEQRTLTATNGQRQIATDAAKAAATEWDRADQQIEQSLTDALMRGFESGKGFAEVLRDTVANMFRTLVLRPIASAIVSPVAGAIANTVTGGIGSMGGSLLGSAAGNYATGAIGAGLWGSSAAYGAALGTTSIGAGSQAAMLAAQTGSFGSAGASATAAAAGNTGTASIMSAAPWLLGGLAVLSLLRSLDKGGTYHTGGLGSFSAAGGSAVGTAVQAQGLNFNLNSRDFRAESESAAVNMAQAVVGLLDSTASAFGRQAGYFAATAFADDTSKSGAWGALMLRLGDKIVLDWGQGADKWPGREFANGEAGAREYAAAVATDVRDYLLTQTPDWADVMLNALGKTPTLENLSAVVAQINQAASALDGMGRASKAFAGLSEAATAALIKAIGGGQAATASLASYYENFYTEQERTALATARLTEQLAALGVALPSSREAFRGLIDAALAAGNTGLAASLLNLSGAFAAIKPAAESASAAARQAQAASTQALRAAIDREKQGWQAAADSAASLRDEVQGVFTTLADGITGLRAGALGTQGSAAQAQQYISQSIAAALATGALPDADRLSGAIGAAREGISAGQFASEEERSFAALVLAGQLETLQAVAGDQLTEAERQRELALQQIERLDSTLQYWEQQVALAQGGIDATISVAEAIRDLQEAMKPGSTAKGKDAAGSTRTPMFAGTPGYSQADYRTSLDGVPDYARGSYVQVGGRYISVDSQSMTSLEDYLAARLTQAYRSPEADMRSTFEQLTQSNFAGSADKLFALALAAGIDPNIIASYRQEFVVPKFAAGGYHTGGVALVGENGPELINIPPAHIYTAPQTSAMLGGNSGVLERLINKLDERMQSVETAIREGNAHAGTTAERLVAVTNGNALVTEPAPAILRP